MPDVMVEIAWDSGYSTPAADRTWTDVSEWLELADRGGPISIQFGRSDERSTADANSLTLTFDNSDGRFTAGLASGAYYPNVRIGRPIRVTTTPVDGSESVRFVGFVESWPVSWDGTDEHATAEISATSRLARLGYDAALSSVIEETILADSPLAYYTLGEPEGALSVADSSGNAQPSLTQAGSGAAVGFGSATGPGTDDLTAASFAGGRYLTGPSPTMSPNVSTLEFFFNVSAAPVASTTLAGSSTEFVEMDSSGHIVGRFGATTTGTYADGNTHHVAVVAITPVPNGEYLFIDGELVASTTGLPNPLPQGTVTLVGANPLAGITATATIAHVAIFSAALTLARIADHAAAGLDGFAAESADDRLERYAAWGGIPAAEVATEAATINVAAIDSTGSTVVDLMRRIEASEGGVLFDDRDGTLTFHSRSHRYDPDTLTLDMAAQQIGADFSTQLDRDGVLNDVTASNSAGTVTARVVDTASRDDLGPMASSLETLSTDDGEPYRTAAWWVNRSAEPKPRVPSLSVDLLTFAAAPSQDDILAATMGTLVTVTGQPSQAPTATGSYFIEGCTETIGPASYTLAFNVSPGEPYTNLVTFDDADRGFDSGAVFAY